MYINAMNATRKLTIKPATTPITHRAATTATLTPLPAHKRGRPDLPPASRKKRVNVMLAPHHQQVASVAGNDNVSAGIATALDHWASVNLKLLVK